jgi:hypothetical protein
MHNGALIKAFFSEKLPADLDPIRPVFVYILALAANAAGTFHRGNVSLL